VALVVAAAGCSGGSSGAASSTAPSTRASSVRHAATLPDQGTVQLPNGRIYTVAPPGGALRLSDIQVRVRSLAWSRSADVGSAPPGTHAYATVRLAVTNRGSKASPVTLTQFWLVDGAGNEYVAAARARVAEPLVGARVGPGATVEGTLVFPAPSRFAGGSLLVYRFADASAIAHAKHLGIARL
jgi:hypothetical protein